MKLGSPQPNEDLSFCIGFLQMQNNIASFIYYVAEWGVLDSGCWGWGGKQHRNKVPGLKHDAYVKRKTGAINISFYEATFLTFGSYIRWAIHLVKG